jgi:hypothetical protein
MIRKLLIPALLSIVLGCQSDREPAPPRPAAPGALPAFERMVPESLLSLVQAEGNVWRTSATGERGAAAAGQLSAGDRLSAGERGRAVLRLHDGREIVLEPGARLLVKTASAGSVQVELEEGQILSRSGVREDGAPSIELTVLTPLGITRLPLGAVKAKIGLLPGQVKIDVDLGQVVFVDRAGREVTAGAQDRIVVTLGGLQLLLARSKATRAAAVVLPTRAGLFVYADDLREVTLSWPAEMGGGAEVEVARDARFEQLLPVERHNASQVTVAAPRRGELHWRVTSGAGAAARRLVGQARFQPDPERSRLDLRHPQNLIDDRVRLTTIHFQGLRPALTFAFSASAGADRYRLRVYRAGALHAPVLEREVRETRCPVAADALEEGNYVWHVLALDGTGRELGGGRMNRLVLAYDNSLSTLAIVRPREGERVEGKEVNVSGAAPLGSTLHLNGRSVPLDDKGRFELRVPRARTLVFRLIGKNGSERYWVRALRLES